MNKITLLLLLLTSNIALAKPIEYDVGDAHVIVVRSIDSWTGDTSLAEGTLDQLKDKTGTFIYYNNKGKQIPGVTYIFPPSTKDPVIEAETEYLKSYGFKLPIIMKGAYTIKIHKAVQIDPAEYPLLMDSQKKMYEQMAIAQGDPDSLESKVSFKKFMAGVLSVGTVVLTANQYGLNAAQIINSSGLPADIYHFATKSKGAVVPLNIPELDVSQYKTIDVRRVVQGNNDRFGQVIIAYKNDKTDELETNALVKAIGSLMGVDTSVDEVKQSRQEDYEAKKAIWEANKNNLKDAKNDR